MTESIAARPGPLSGVRVLDITRFPPGSFCTVLLADLGAEVWRVDAPGSNPERAGNGVGLSRGKRSIALDLRHPQGLVALRKIAARADVLVENHRPGDLERRGFGYRQVSEELPGLVWCSISAFGQDGPYATWPAHDLGLVAHSGLLSSINPALPWHPQMVFAVPFGATMAAAGIAAALVERGRTGRGCQLDISLSESLTWLLASSDSDVAGRPRGIPVTPDRQLYRCADGRWVAVTAAEPKTWAALCQGLDLADLAEISPWTDIDGISTRLGEAFAALPARTWVEQLGASAAVTMVNEPVDLAQDPQVRHREALIDVAGVTVPRSPIRVADDPDLPPRPAAATPPPEVGADTDAILAAAGMELDEIEELRRSGVLGERTRGDACPS